VSIAGISYYSYARKYRANLAMDFTGIKNAAEDTSGWGWIKSASTLLFSMHSSFYASYATMKQCGTLQPGINFVYSGWLGGTNYAAYIRTNSASKPIRSTVDNAGVTYKNRIALLTNFTNKTSLQLFFDEPDIASVGNGYLLIVKPYYFETEPGTVYSETGIFETRAMSSGNNKVMYVSFSGSPWKQTGHTYPVSGRIKMVDDGTNFRVTGLIYTYVDGSKGYSTCFRKSGYSFYTFAYIASNKSPYFTTGLRGWNDSSISDKICGVNLYNYGHFNFSSGFVCDAQSTSCPESFPYPLNGDVYTLYSGTSSTITREFNEKAISGLVIPFVDWLTFK
jgi:hypothetical protein